MISKGPFLTSLLGLGPDPFSFLLYFFLQDFDGTLDGVLVKTHSSWFVDWTYFFVHVHSNGDFSECN